MFKNYLAGIDGVALYPILAFVIFFTAFLMVLLLTFTRKRNAFDALAALPLDLNEQNLSSKIDNHETE